jgi:hypothetical protein
MKNKILQFVAGLTLVLAVFGFAWRSNNKTSAGPVSIAPAPFAQPAALPKALAPVEIAPLKNLTAKHAPAAAKGAKTRVLTSKPKQAVLPSPQPVVAAIQPPVPAPAFQQDVGLGRHFIDGDFGSRAIQVTSASDGKACYNAYSYWPSFNKDSTKFFIACDEKPVLYSFDPINFKIISKQDLFAAGANPDWQDAIWSGTSANILYAQRGLKLWAYNTASRTYALVKDFSGELPGKYLWQMSKSVDDSRFAFTLEDVNNNYARTAYMVWDKTQDKIIYQRAVSALDEVQLDKSGRYLVVKTGVEGKGKVRMTVVDLNTQTATDLLDNGLGTLLGYDNWNNSFTIRNLSDPHNYKTIFSLGNDWTQAAHISFLGNDENWALVSLYTPGGLKAGKYHDEIILVSTNGSGKVKELVKTHSVIKDYWDTPRANISRDGKFVIFSSNWDSLRRDVYLLKVD